MGGFICSGWTGFSEAVGCTLWSLSSSSLFNWVGIGDGVLLERLDDAVPVEFLDDDLLALLGDGVLRIAGGPGPLGVGGLFLDLGPAPPPLLLVTLMLLLMVQGSGAC